MLVSSRQCVGDLDGQNHRSKLMIIRGKCC